MCVARTFESSHFSVVFHVENDTSVDNGYKMIMKKRQSATAKRCIHRLCQCFSRFTLGVFLVLIETMHNLDSVALLPT